MSVDLKELRQLAEKLCRELPEGQLAWAADRAFVHCDDSDKTEIAEVLEPHQHRWMLARYIAAVSPSVVLELLDRLEHAEASRGWSEDLPTAPGWYRVRIGLCEPQLLEIAERGGLLMVVSTYCPVEVRDYGKGDESVLRAKHEWHGPIPLSELLP